MCLDGECSWSRQYQDLPVWLPNGFNTGCQFTIPWGLVGTCWKVHIFVPKIKAGSYWYLSKWMKEASSRKRQTPTPFENEHVPWKGTISKGRKSTRDKSLRTSPGNSVGVRDFGNFRTQENESIYIKNLLDYYWHRTKNPLTSNSSFWRYVFCKKSILAQHHNKHIHICQQRKETSSQSFLHRGDSPSWFVAPAFPRWISMFSSLGREERLGGLFLLFGLRSCGVVCFHQQKSWGTFGEFVFGYTVYT